MMNWEVIFDFDSLSRSIKKLENETISENFWLNKENAHNVLKKIKTLKLKTEMLG